MSSSKLANKVDNKTFLHNKKRYFDKALNTNILKTVSQTKSSFSSIITDLREEKEEEEERKNTKKKKKKKKEENVKQKHKIKKGRKKDPKERGKC